MPPKPKFTREEMLEAALAIVRDEGEAALTARRLGEALGSSARPVFTLFASMEEVKEALLPLAGEAFYEHCRRYEGYSPAFKQIGISIVSFAQEQTNLFAFLFMSPHAEKRSLDDWCQSELGDEAIRVIERDYGLSREVSEALFREMWLHTFALCVLKVTGAAELSPQEVSDSLSRAFLGLYSLAKAGMLTQAGIRPVQGDNGPLAGDAPCVEVALPDDGGR